MKFNPGLDVRVHEQPLGIEFGPKVFGSPSEYRSLDAIRQSLDDPNCDGPDPVYAISMDVGKAEHREELLRRMLLFGVVTYATGRLGKEPVRSHGHVHSVAPHSRWRPPEIYEIWAGRAVVYMQEFAADYAGRCFAVTAETGETVVVPPGWAHATLSAAPEVPLTFGALCDRESGFEYQQIRIHRGMAWYAVLNDEGQLEWYRNPTYLPTKLNLGPPRDYKELALETGVPIYTQFENDPEAVQWVSEPARLTRVWQSFTPCLIASVLGQ
jgi:glucose-6-phosphate isomerase